MTDTPGLHWADWIVFCAMIVASLAIGKKLLSIKSKPVKTKI